MAQRTAGRGQRRPPVELGDEPPLVLGEADPARLTARRGISWRWLFGALVTAVTSTALMGGALFGALDGRYVVRAEAAPVPPALPATPAQRARKGDRVRPAYEAVSSRRVIEISTVVRQGEERLIAKRPYALVTASLVLDRKDIGDVPAYEAKALEPADARSADSVTDAISAQDVDGEITVSVSAFPLDGDVTFDDDLTLPDTEVERQLRAEVDATEEEDEAIEDDAFLAPSHDTAPNVVVIPENVSELIKTADGDERLEADSELVELVQPGDTLSKILVGSGVSADDVAAIDAILGRLGLATLRPGQTLSIAFQLDEEGDVAQRQAGALLDLRRARPRRDGRDDRRRELRAGRGAWRSAARGGRRAARRTQGADPWRSTRASHQTTVDHDLPDRVRDLLVATFANEVDYNAPVRPGDALTVLHSVENDGGPAEVLFAALTAAGVEKRFYRFKSDDGAVHYYDEDGRTGDRFLMRKPMERGVFRSGFGMRRHPILRRQRMHKGVDYAAPRGTKIYAAGDGVVQQAGWKAGYGRWVSIKHRNGYVTGYAHQSSIANGITPGTKVKQGQVIGYVGSTGFSTGPHLHYEVHVNGRPVNPLKIRLRRGKELSGEALSEFRSERDRIDALLAAQKIEVAGR
ncbi:LysM peptidoglycan-binding domain-containing M23 family metallopeptidase [Acuticoccus sp.]|uniref:LysM peptidoglycan-binding domain-containing M23 family metallopeptidase n=1 Tax=Acuticoccus sp. TaxID=1904378 RepID=UPI003B528474